MRKRRSTFSTPKGVTILPVSPIDIVHIQTGIENEHREAGAQIDVPTYDVSIGDDIQTHEHEHILDENGEVVSSTLQTDEQKELWQKYLDDNKTMIDEVALVTTEYFLLEGVEVDWKQFNGWEERKKRYKISVPENEDEKKIYFLQSVVWTTAEAQIKAIREIIRVAMAGADPERVEAIEKLFRS